MYTLYNSPSGKSESELSLGRHERVLTAHRQNLNRVRDYYKRASYAVRSDHILVRILQDLPDGEGLDLAQYRDRVEDYTDALTRSLDFTSPVNVGRTFDTSSFFGEGVEELVLIHNTSFSIGDFKANWRKQAPVTFLRHPIKNLNLQIPDGINKGGETGLCIVHIDVARLACQYRLWRERQRRINPDLQRTPMQFVYEVPLTNALASLADIAYFNMLDALFSGERLVHTPHPHPFYLNTYFEDTNELLAETIHRLIDRRMSFYDVLESIQPVNAPTLRDVIKIPSMAFTRQVRWLLVISRLPLIAMMLLWDERTGGSFNRGAVNDVKRSLRQLRSDAALNAIKSDNLKDLVHRELDMEIKRYF